MAALSKEGPWYREIAALIAHQDQEGFAKALCRWINAVFSYDLIVLFAYRGPARPQVLFDNFPRANKPALETYRNGTYVLDPFYQACTEGTAPGVYRMRDVAPAGYFEIERYRQYNVTVTAAEEMGYRTSHWPEHLEEVGLFSRLPNGAMAIFSLYRRSDSPPITDEELDRLGQVVPIIDALTHRHWGDIWHAETHAPEDIHGRSPGIDIEAVFLAMDDPALTDREREVMSLILRGHSSESIGLCLAISEETVKTHRKNAYAKLSISSQSELFALFIETLSSMTRSEKGAHDVFYPQSS